MHLGGAALCTVLRPQHLPRLGQRKAWQASTDSTSIFSPMHVLLPLAGLLESMRVPLILAQDNLTTVVQTPEDGLKEGVCAMQHQHTTEGKQAV